MKQHGHLKGTRSRNRARVAWAAALAGLASSAAMLVGCGGGGSSGGSSSPPVNSAAPPAVQQAEKAGTPVDTAIVAADNAFGLNLLNTLALGSSGNIAISPISVALALQIVYNGAQGDTQTAMSQTLELGGLSISELNADNAALQASLVDPDPNVQIIIANSLWMHLSNNPVLPSFTSTDQTYYGATVGDLSGAPGNVNDWVAGATNGLITTILPPTLPGYYDDVRAVVANTIYFKGKWTTTFDPSQTAVAPFTLGDGSEVSAEMMQQTGSYEYFQGTLQGASFQAVRLPYGSGRLNMLIVLPDAGIPLTTFVAAMTAQALNSWNAQFENLSGSIALPRFKATYSQSLPRALTTLGMGGAFCPNQADFAGIGSMVCIADVEHATVVEVDESGTIATGATTVTLGSTAVAAPQFTMTMAHPFFYAIQDQKTGELLFVGLLMDPS